MANRIEIGGNFWLSPAQLLQGTAENDQSIGIFDGVEDLLLTSSGRGAVKLLLNSLKPRHKKVLLPGYTCDSVIKPFKDLGYELLFYKINSDLTVDLDDLAGKVEREKPGILFLLSYFGFDTLKSVRPYYQSFKEKGMLLIEDLSHSWFSAFPKTSANYSVISMRKWLELPDGGALIDSGITPASFYNDYTEQTPVVSLFSQASELKNTYLASLRPELKEQYLPLFYSINDLLDEQTEDIYQISRLSARILRDTDFGRLKNKRRENYRFLQERLSDNACIDLVFPELPEEVVPLYLPVSVRNDDRNALQRHLAENRIYCPVHWPVPEEIRRTYSRGEIEYQQHLFSIVCDQRYSLPDMQRMVDCINNFNK